MNWGEFFSSNILGLVFILAFFGAVVLFLVLERNRQGQPFRPIRAFESIRRQIGLAVEAGKRLQVTLGWGSLNGLEGASALIGLSALERIARTASVSDRPPVATSGDGTLAILSQETAQSVFRSIGAEAQDELPSGRLSGLTPFGYTAGVLPVIYDEQVAMTLLAGHFGSEVALITHAADRAGSFTLAGSDDLTAQAVLYATAEEALIGEELYATGAYLRTSLAHNASVRAEDFFRWVLVVIILAGAALKLIGL